MQYNAHVKMITISFAIILGSGVHMGCTESTPTNSEKSSVSNGEFSGPYCGTSDVLERDKMENIMECLRLYIETAIRDSEVLADANSSSDAKLYALNDLKAILLEIRKLKSYIDMGGNNSIRDESQPTSQSATQPATQPKNENGGGEKK